MFYCTLSLGVLQHILPKFLVTCPIWCVLEYSFRELWLDLGRVRGGSDSSCFG